MKITSKNERVKKMKIENDSGKRNANKILSNR